MLLCSFLTFSLIINSREYREWFNKFKMALEGMSMMISEKDGINPVDIENWGCKYASVKV